MQSYDNYLTYCLSFAGAHVQQRSGVLELSVMGQPFCLLGTGGRLSVTVQSLPNDISFLLGVYPCVRRQRGNWITIHPNDGMAPRMVQRLISSSFGLRMRIPYSKSG